MVAHIHDAAITITTKPFYFQVSWGMLERNHIKTGTKQERGKERTIIKSNKKKRKDDKTLSQESEKEAGKKT
jgi:hypothetical protein